MRPPKLRTKLTLFYAAVFTLLLAGASTWFYKLFAFQLNKYLTEELSDRAVALRSYLRIKGDHVQLVYDATDPDEA